MNEKPKKNNKRKNKIITSEAPSGIPIPERRFIEFIKDNEIKSVREIVEHEEWKNIFSHFYEFDEYEMDIVYEDEETMDNYSPQRQVEEITKCVNSFAYWCHKYAKISHPMAGLINLVLYKYQKYTIDCFVNNRFTIVKKFRQAGLTMIAVLFSLWKCLFTVDQKILLISRTDREAISSGSAARLTLDHLPKWMPGPMNKKNEHEYSFKDSNSTLWFFTPEAARSKSITILFVDEAAFIANMDEFWAASYPVISTGGSVAVISTCNGVGNWYYEQYTLAEQKKNAFKLIDLHYWQHPDYCNPEWVTSTRQNLGERKWAQEILGSFLESGNNFINLQILEEMEQKIKNLVPLRVCFPDYANENPNKVTDDFEGNAMWIWKEPQENHEYILSVDASEGLGLDNSCFQIIDSATIEQVAEFYSDSIPPHIFAQIVNQMGYYYNTATVVVEALGIGTAVTSALQHDLGYDNLYFDTTKKQQTPGLKTNKINRIVFLEALQSRIATETVKINSKRLIEEMKTFIFNPRSKKAEAAKNKNDDAIMAFAMGLFVRDQISRDVPVGHKSIEDTFKVYRGEIYEDIKREILQGTDEEWLNEGENFSLDDESLDDELGKSFIERRRKNKVLIEFNW